jgi:hypothetical protein
MTKHIHIVYVHPVELGEPNLHKVEFEKEFDTKEYAEEFIEGFNKMAKPEFKAVYYGCVNDETGELV